MRDDWKTYLNSWLKQDREVGEIVQELKDAGKLDNTVIFFLTDHGISHIRGKQFLYEEGIRVPLIIRFPDGRLAKTVREDLTIHIDLAPTSLALADIEIPEYFQGHDIFAKSSTPRDFIIAARDRCDETIEIIRCVRTQQYKYIRNFLSYRPHAQPNQYKDGKKISMTMRKLHEEGKLNELQGRIYNPTRPTEELYDLKSDPNETKNLAADPKYAKQLAKLRKTLYDWMVETKDLGLIPEPIAEDLGKKYGNDPIFTRKSIQHPSGQRKHKPDPAINKNHRSWRKEKIKNSAQITRNRKRLPKILGSNLAGSKQRQAIRTCPEKTNRVRNPSRPNRIIARTAQNKTQRRIPQGPDKRNKQPQRNRRHVRNERD